MAPDGRRLVAVRTDVIVDLLVDGVAQQAAEQPVDGLPAAVATALGRALEAVLDAERLEHAAPGAQLVARRLALSGYRTRVVETERFAPARVPVPDVAAELAAASDDPAEALFALAGGWSRAESAERPAPDSGAASWRVPGPGGHVRHLLAVRAAREAAGGAGAEDPLTLKRCWMYGFFVRCAEDA